MSRWCVFAWNSSTTETQRTQRLHREEGLRDFLCKAIRLHLFSLSVRMLSITSAILGIAALLFYGYRLLIVNRRTQENKDARRKHQYDQAHVYGRVLYYDSGDPRLFNDTYLLNFANKWNYLLLACVIKNFARSGVVARRSLSVEGGWQGRRLPGSSSDRCCLRRGT